jgi:hypothetical protein
MKYLLSITTYLLLGFAFQSSSCRKTNGGQIEQKIVCTTANTAYIPADARSRFFFKEGSWWVYKNIANSEFDTVKLEKCDYWLDKPNKERWGDFPDKCYEWAEVRFQSSKYNYHLTRIEFAMPNTNIDSLNEIYKITDTYNNRASFKLSYNGGNVYSDQDSGYIAHYDSIGIKGEMYSDILYYQTTNPYDYVRNIHFAANVGAIKMTRTDGTTWELFKANIIK